MTLRFFFVMLAAMTLWVMLATAVLYVPARAQPVSQCVSSAAAGGTANGLTVVALPCSATTTLLILTLTATNTSTTPTLQMTGGAAQQIVNADGSAVAVGQLVAGTIILLTNTGSKWRVLNGAPA